MAVLQKIRVKFGLAISIIIALALLSFIIDPSTLESALSSMSSKYDVGQIAGKSISYNDFQEDIQRFTTVHEVSTGSSVQGEEAQKQIRDAAWQSLIDKYLFLKNAKAAGIKVGEAEMLALTSGETTNAVLSQNYAFLDENGNYNPDAIVQLVQNVDQDPSGSLGTYWKYLQNAIYTQQYYDKYYSLFRASDIQNPLAVRNAVEGNNTTANVEFVTVPVGFDKDSTIVVTPQEIKDYYKKHKDFFKQQANRDIEYVVYEVIPSEEDINAASESIQEVFEEFASTTNMKKFLAANSERQYSDYWYKNGELNTILPAINDFVFANPAGSVSQIDRNDNHFYSVKVMEEAKIADSVYVKHILLAGDNAAAQADSLVDVLNAKKNTFSALAALYSVDQNSAADGELGNLGWMTQTYMIPGFESVIDAEINKPYVIKTQYGQHVVMVSKKSSPIVKKKVAILEKSAIAGKDTFNDFYAKANKFATLANGSYQNYLAAVDSMGVYSHKVNNVLESTESYGSVDNAKEVTRWIYDNKSGKVSNIITVNQNFFFIVALKAVREDGIASLASVAPTIEARLYSEKAVESKAAQLAAEVEGLTDLQAIAEKLGTSVNTAEEMAFSAYSSQRYDPAFVGAVAGAEQGKLYGPVEGLVGVYFFQVNSRDTGSFYTEDDAKMYAAQKAQYTSQMVVPTMMQDADVKDNRARFY